MSKSVEQMVSEQVQRSEIARKLRIEDKQTCQTTVVTVSRRMGSGARIVAMKLAEELGMSYWGRELLDPMAQEADVSRRIVEAFDEKAISEFETFARATFGDQDMGSFLYLRHLARAVAAISKLGYAVIVGRGANFLLPKALHVRIDGSFDFRVQNMIKFECLTKQQAESKLRSSDKERDKFLVATYGQKKVAEAQYDVTLCMDRLSVDGATKIIKAALIDRCPHFAISSIDHFSARELIVQNI